MPLNDVVRLWQGRLRLGLLWLERQAASLFGLRAAYNRPVAVLYVSGLPREVLGPGCGRFVRKVAALVGHRSGGSKPVALVNRNLLLADWHKFKHNHEL